jgi:hypothetical protein
MAGDQVLQAGVAAKVQPARWGVSSVEYWAWTEWWSAARKDPSHRVKNFDVRAGDQVSVLVCAKSASYGQVTLMNRRSGKATSIGVPAPEGVHLTGSSVEWVVEGVSKALPCFGTMTFGECVAATEHTLFDLRPRGLPLNISGVSSDGVDAAKLLTRTFVTADKQFAVEWLAFM